MKIVAQSEIPAQQPYLHLAYGAATMANNPVSYLVVVTVAVVIAFHRVTNQARRKRTSAAVITSVLMLGFIFIVSAYESQRNETRHRMIQLHSALVSQHYLGVPIPDTINAMKKKLDIPTLLYDDYWGKSMKVIKFTRNGKVDFIVTSAGRDGRFGTGDDLSCPPREKVVR